VALDRQAPWISVAVVGVVVGAASGALWLLSFRRAVATRVLAVVTAVEAMPEATAAVELDDRRVRLRGGAPRLYHRSDCQLVAGRAVQALAAADRLEPCEACRA
jgi:hypothetical protein